MRIKTYGIIFAVFLITIAAIFLPAKLKSSKPDQEVIKVINPFVGNLQNVISTTGTVLPKNRLEIKPPINGRVDEILVAEGQKVKSGQILVWMSSAERAALLDAARGQDEKTLAYWKQVYKPIPLMSPIEAEVIVAKVQAGQTVTVNEAVIVLSDQLICRAQVDETDIRKVRIGQAAVVELDAYPDTKIKAKAGHIYYESKTVNNVTIYEVDLIPEEIPSFFRSGMNATVNFMEVSKENVLLIAQEAIQKENDETFVMVKEPGKKEPMKRVVRTGISDDKNVEIISGIDENDEIIIKSKKFVLPKSNGGTNPFLPRRRNSGR